MTKTGVFGQALITLTDKRTETDMAIIEILSMILCIFLAIIIGLYLGNMIRNRNRGKSGKIKNR